jgi:hypothetical protein
MALGTDTEGLERAWFLLYSELGGAAMEHETCVVMQRGHEDTEVHIHCPDKDRIEMVKELILDEMGDPGVGTGDRCIYFKLTPDGKFKDFDAFEAWLRDELEKAGQTKVVTV